MKHDFETLVNRSDKYSIKWRLKDEHNSNIDKNIPPFSVADFDLKYPKKLTDGFKAYVDEMIFGYSQPDENYYNSFIDWMKRRHGFIVQRDWILNDNGVVSSICNSIKTFSNEDEGVIIMTPVYPPFAKRVLANNRKLVECPLINTDGNYTIDFDLFERQAADSNNKMLILCSPHNPVGRIWREDELLKITEIANKNGIIVVSDEIHMDLEIGNNKHLVYGSISEAALDNSVILTSAGKTFNLAGARTSMIIIKNEAMRKAYNDHVIANCHISLNAFGFKLYEIAYTECEDWVDEFLLLIKRNYELMRDYFLDNHPTIKVTPLQGTYLLWLNVEGLNMSDDAVYDFLADQCQIYINRGDSYGDSGKGFIRWNIATPTWVLENALKRLSAGLKEL